MKPQTLRLLGVGWSWLETSTSDYVYVLNELDDGSVRRVGALL